jgi:hypothetical protein
VGHDAAKPRIPRPSCPRGRLQKPSPLELGQPGVEVVAAIGRRRHELGHDVAAVGDRNVLAGAEQANVLAEPGLELAKLDLPHAARVAS